MTQPTLLTHAMPPAPEAPPLAFAYKLELWVTQQRVSPDDAVVAESSRRILTGDAHAILAACPGLLGLHVALAGAA